jgi:hypothetical protein
MTSDLTNEVVDVRLAALENWREDCEAAGYDPAPAPADTYPDLDAFVRDELAPTYLRWPTLGAAQMWCPHWREHAEAVARLHALWRAWEHLAAHDTGTGAGGWHRDHLDHQLPLLTSNAGPFARCTSGHQADYPPVQVDPTGDGAHLHAAG